MKIPKSVLFETAIIVGLAVLFKVALVLLNAHVGTSTTGDTANLPVHSGHVTITISNQEFRPAVIVVTAGTTITWINHDPMTHTATEGQNASPVPHGFNSNLLTSGQSWSYVFKTPGTYMYTCEVHPSMNAKVVVKKA
ncbi:MAG TPA: plastocyanin/azurin family copper-binding protein [Ktedonobacteraceae bacterium]|jgi:plastocyanin